MDIDTELILELLSDDNVSSLRNLIDNILRDEVNSPSDWKDFVNIIRTAFSRTYQKHWLKTNKVILSLFNNPELLGVDCNIFDELKAIAQPFSVEQASSRLFEILIEIVKVQMKSGGSTLFFDIGKIASTRSAIITSDLIDARYRETVLILNEIDNIIPTLTKEWVNVSRLWKSGNGYRLMRATEFGVVIHVKEYEDIKRILLNELDIKSEKLLEATRHLEGVKYLQLSETLDNFVTGLVASRGIRGEYEPHFKSWIDHEGLDEF
jgi:hypothetical protein